MRTQRRRAWRVSVAGVLVGLAGLIGAPSPAGAVGQCDEPYQLATNVPGGGGVDIAPTYQTAKLRPTRSDSHYAFGASRDPGYLEIAFNAEPALPVGIPSSLIKVTASLHKDGTGIVNKALVPSTILSGGQLLVELCIDPSQAHAMPAGTYTGFVAIEDPRLPVVTAPITVTLKYEHPWYLIGGYALLLFTLGSFGVWLGTLRARKLPLDRTNLRADFPRFLSLNAYGIGAGLLAAAGVLYTQYFNADAWAGTINDHFVLLFAIVPAYLGGLATGAVITTPTLTSTSTTTTSRSTDAAVTVPAATRSRRVDESTGTVPPPAAPAAGRRRRNAWVRPAIAGLAFVAVVTVIATQLNYGSNSSAIPAPSITVPPTQVTVTSSGEPPASTTVTPVGTAPDGVPDVYDTEAAAGLARLTAAGYLPFAYQVCSSSVAADHIRQVLLADGTILVDKTGPTNAATSLARGTRVQVKVGTGHPCT